MCGHWHELAGRSVDFILVVNKEFLVKTLPMVCASVTHGAFADLIGIDFAT